MSQSPLAEPSPWDAVSDAYAAEIQPDFEAFAKAALDDARLPEGARVLDVGAGPGTLAFVAAERGARVTAVDFAPAMIDKLRDRAARERREIEVAVADAAALPYADGSFDAAFSMFVFIFVPDRAKAFREMHRVLRPGGRGAVSSWVPLRRADPLFAAMFGGLRKRVPGMPPDDGTAPLGTVDDARAEMAAAGFTNVTAREIRATSAPKTPHEWWESMQRSGAPILLMKKRMGDAWSSIDAGVRDDLTAQFGTAPRPMTLTAILVSGTRA